SLFQGHCATQREWGPWRLGESRQGKPSRKGGGIAAWQLCVGQVGRLATKRTAVVANRPGWIVRVRRKFHRFVGDGLRGNVPDQVTSDLPVVVWPAPLPPSDVQHGEDFLSFAFFADPAQFAQVFERPVQRELVRCDFGKPVLGVHWSHRLAPKNILWL